MTAKSAYVVGLTGGVGTGKTTVARAFAELGAFVVDVDDISHALTAKSGPAIADIAASFPGIVVDGVLDRARLRQRVFSDASARQQLESILHPLIGSSARRTIASDAARKAAYVLLVVPLLFESDRYANIIECAIVVDAPVEMQIERVVASRGIAGDEVERIVSTQMPREQRLARAQFVINNAGGREALAAQVERLHRGLAANAVARAGEVSAEAFA